MQRNRCFGQLPSEVHKRCVIHDRQAPIVRRWLRLRITIELEVHPPSELITSKASCQNLAFPKDGCYFSVCACKVVLNVSKQAHETLIILLTMVTGNVFLSEAVVDVA